MGRRSDHTRAELEALIIETGHAHMAEVGFAKFSAREVAKRIGYSIGTIYNIFASYDRLILAINGRTLDLWADMVEQQLSTATGNRLHALVRSYFRFAEHNTHAWTALYDHRLPAGEVAPDWYDMKRGRLFMIIEAELRAALGDAAAQAADLARLLYAAVHGICTLALNGTLAAIGADDGEAMAIDLVDQQVAASRGRASNRDLGI